MGEDQSVSHVTAELRSDRSRLFSVVGVSHCRLENPTYPARDAGADGAKLTGAVGADV